jgi:hypothetical protein
MDLAIWPGIHHIAIWLWITACNIAIQVQSLHPKLESHLYFQGSHDIYRYTDDFDELAVTAGYSDALVRVTKYCSGLDPRINVAITMSGTAPDLTDYDGWCLRAFRQYEVFGRA